MKTSVRIILPALLLFAAGTARCWQELPAAREVESVAGVPAGVEFNGVLFPRTVFSDQGTVSGLLVSAVENSQESLKLALYDFTLQGVLDAISAARIRRPGLSVQVVLDERHVFPARGRRSPQIGALLKVAGVEVRMLRGAGSSGLMHNKFCVFDGKMVEFGSYNWSQTAEDKNHENALFSVESARVKAYSDYWAWLWENAAKTDAPHGAPALTPGPPADSSRVSFNGFEFPGAAFSPKGGVEQWLIAAIERSQESIHVAMFNFSSQKVADALLARKRAGVKIRLVLDKWQSSGDPVLSFLQKNGFEVYLRNGKAGGVMHNKFAVFDGRMVATGSFNWSDNAQLNNFENVSFITNSEDAAAFQSYYHRLDPGADLAVRP